MESERQRQWTAILEMSSRMLDQARAKEWTEVAEIEAARRKSLEAFFDQPVDAVEAERVREGIERILATDKEIASLGEVAREGLATQLGGLARGRRAQAAYNQNR